MKQVEIAAIRIYANELVGPCTDAQIIFVAQKMGVIGAFALWTESVELSELCEPELVAVALMMEREVTAYRRRS